MQVLVTKLEILGKEIIADEDKEIPEGKYFNYMSEWVIPDIIDLGFAIVSC